MLNESQVEDFFKKYLALFGVDGNRQDFYEISEWACGMGQSLAYPRAFQKAWPLPVGKMYGYVTDEAVKAYWQITDCQNWSNAIKSYIEWVNTKDTVKNNLGN